jgi:hypothetical protein
VCQKLAEDQSADGRDSKFRAGSGSGAPGLRLKVAEPTLRRERKERQAARFEPARCLRPGKGVFLVKSFVRKDSTLG